MSGYQRDLREARTSAGVIRYEDVGEGPPVVFTHAVLLNGAVWRKVVPLLADRCRCIVPDWPMGGHASPMAADADLSPPGLARLIVELLDALDIDRATLVGNDSGGALCQLVAAEHADRVDRLVLTTCDAYDNFPPRRFRYLQWSARVPGGVRVIAELSRFGPVLRSPIAFGPLTKRPLDRAVVDGYSRHLRANAAIRRDTAKVLRGMHRRYTLAAAEKLRRFEQPVLIAWSAEDKVFPVRYGERLAAELPNARLELIHDALTLVSEDQPERTAQLIGDFVAVRA